MKICDFCQRKICEPWAGTLSYTGAGDSQTFQSGWQRDICPECATNITIKPRDSDKFRPMSNSRIADGLQEITWDYKRPT